MRCADGVCAAGRVLGEACATDDDCELPLVCDRARFVCAKPWADLGEACGAAAPCLLSFQCDAAAAAGAQPVCVRRARHREQCDAAAGCEYPYTCAGYCTDLRHARALGDSCASTVDCAAGLLCLPTSAAAASASPRDRVCQAPAAACGAARVLPRCSTEGASSSASNSSSAGEEVCVLPHAPASAAVAERAEAFMLCIDAHAFHWSDCAAPFARLLAAFGSRARWQPCAPWATVPVPAPPPAEPSSVTAPASGAAAAAAPVAVVIFAVVVVVVVARALAAASGPV